MKNDNNDLVRNKLESLDTLAGGIVFGKEEAWEKLQARMESKPARKISLQYRMAAAAALLIFVCAMTVYYYPVKEVVVNSYNKRIKKPGNNIQTIQQPVIPLTKRPGTIVDNKVAATEEKRHIAYTPRETKTPDAPILTTIQAIQPPAIENKQDTAVAQTSAPPVAESKPMNVVHINDLESSSHEARSMVVNTQPVDLNKLRVIHINDMEKQEIEVKKILHENRMTLGHYPFIRPVYHYPDADEQNNDLNEYAAPGNPLKNIFNPQN